jgi:hypothetical protein
MIHVLGSPFDLQNNNDDDDDDNDDDDNNNNNKYKALGIKIPEK